jgi:hypothetical protein
MIKLSLNKAAGIVLALLIYAAGLSGCVTGSTGSSTPDLPAGFTTIAVPDVDLAGYIYFNQGSPVTISTDVLPEEIDLTDETVGIEAAQLWLGPDVNSVGGTVTFSTTSSVQDINEFIDSYGVSVWTMSGGKSLYAVNDDSSQWTDSLKNALKNGLLIDPASKYADAAKDFLYFPSNPPCEPFAAGSIDLNSSIFESASSSLNVSLTDYLSGLQSAKIDRINFVAYSTQPVNISSDTLTTEYFSSLNLSVLAVGHSSYPDVALSVYFDKAMSDAGLTKYTTDNVDIYKYPLDEATVLVTHKGSVIYAAVSQTENAAEQLLLSCFN